MTRKSKTQKLVQFSILLAIEAIFCFTPLGSLPIGPIVATLMYIPVVLTAILLGTGYGSLMGFFAGLFSFIVWSFMPPPSSILFAGFFTPVYAVGGGAANAGSLVICFVPRVLVGTVAGAMYAALKKLPGKLQWLRFLLPGMFGSLVATLGVLGGIWLFFGQAYAAMLGTTMSALILVTLTTNGLLEIGIAGIVGLVVCMPLQKALAKQR